MSVDLLNLHITNILENEKLSAVYIVNGEAKYVSLKVDNKYNLHKISNYEIDEYIGYSETLGRLDFIVGERLHTHIISQSAVHQNKKDNTTVSNPNYTETVNNDNIIRVVMYITDETNLKDLKKPTSKREENTRYISKKIHKLF